MTRCIIISSQKIPDQRRTLGQILCLSLTTIVLIALTVLPTAHAFGFNPDDAANVSTTVSKSSVQVAEPFIIEIRVTAPTGTRVVWPGIGNQLGDFEVTKTQDINDLPSTEKPQGRVWQRRLTLESIATGELEIPAMEIQTVNGNESTTINSKPTTIRIVSVLEDRADPTQFRDIHGVVDAALPLSRTSPWIWWTASGVGLLVLTIAIIAVVSKRRKWLSPTQWALDEIDVLRESPAMRNKDGEVISNELSSILRNYLEMQFGISGPVQTSQELVCEITTSKQFRPETTERLVDIFTSSDRVKFAGWDLTDQEMSLLINDAQQLIELIDREVPSEITPHNRVGDK